MIYLANNKKNIFLDFIIPISGDKTQIQYVKAKALLDTGFSGGLYISNKYKDRIKTKEFKTFSTFQYADGRVEKLSVYNSIIIYENHALQLETVFADVNDYLLGMQFLQMFDLKLSIALNSISLQLATMK